MTDCEIKILLASTDQELCEHIRKMLAKISSTAVYSLFVADELSSVLEAA